MPKQRGETTLHRLFDTALSALLVIDLEGRISRANKAADELFGYPESMLVGQSIEALIPAPLWNELAPTLRPLDERRELRALRRDGTQIVVLVGQSTVAYQHGMLLELLRDSKRPRRTHDERRRDVENAPRLPAALAAELCAAAHAADSERLTILVGQMVTDFGIIAGVLGELVDEYQYEEIEALLRI